MFRCGILPTYHASHRHRKSFWNLPGHDFGFVFVLGFSFCPRLVRSYSLVWVWGLRIVVGVVLGSSAPGSGKPAVNIYRFGLGERYTDGWDSPLPPPYTFLHTSSALPYPQTLYVRSLYGRLSCEHGEHGEHPCEHPPVRLCNIVAFRADVL